MCLAPRSFARRASCASQHDVAASSAAYCRWRGARKLERRTPAPSGLLGNGATPAPDAPADNTPPGGGAGLDNSSSRGSASLIFYAGDPSLSP